MNIFKKLLISSTILTIASPVISQVNANQKLTPSRDKKILEREILIAENELKKENNTLKITVTGSRTPRPVDTFPGSIEVLNQEDLNSKSGLTIREIFNDIPGVTTQASKQNALKGTPNKGDNINIRGLDKNRVLFLIDGIKLPTYNYGSVDSPPDYYSMNQGSYVDFNTLAALEIIKGPASALYGADALGGLVSYRTLNPSDLLQGEDFKIELPVNYDSSDNGLTESFKIATKLSENISALVIYTREDGNETEVKTQDKYQDNETIEGNNYFINLTANVNDYSDIEIIYENVDRDFEVTSKSDNLTEMASTVPGYANYTYQSHKTETNTKRDRLSLKYDYDNPESDSFINGSEFKLYSQYAKVNDNSFINSTETSLIGQPTQVRSDVNNYYLKNDLYGGELELKSILKFGNNDHNLTYGIQYDKTETSRNRERDRTISGTTTNTNSKDTPDTDITNTAFFIQDEFSKGKFDFIAGLRFDNYELDAKVDSTYRDGISDPNYSETKYAADLDESSWSPKLAATYNFSNNLSGYAQYSKGFRAPAYYEVNSGFDNFSGGYTTKSNPNLKPETSNSYEVGIRGRFQKLDYNLSAFYNDYNDFIEQLKQTGTTSETRVSRGVATTKTLDVYESVNTDSAETKGIEFSTEYYFSSDRNGFSTFGSLAYTEGNNLTDNVPLTSINPLEAKIGLSFKSDDNKWFAKIVNTFTGRPTVKDDETNFIPQESSVTDFISSYKPNDNYEFSLGVYNLFDTTYYNYQDVKDKEPTLANLTRFSQPGTYVRAGFKIRF